MISINTHGNLVREGETESNEWAKVRGVWCHRHSTLVNTVLCSHWKCWCLFLFFSLYFFHFVMRGMRRRSSLSNLRTVTWMACDLSEGERKKKYQKCHKNWKPIQWVLDFPSWTRDETWIIGIFYIFGHSYRLQRAMEGGINWEWVCKVIQLEPKPFDLFFKTNKFAAHFYQS